MSRRNRLLAAVALGMVLTAVTATAQPQPATIKVDKVAKVNVGGSFGLEVTWANCNNIASVFVSAKDKNGVDIGSGEAITGIVSGTSVNFKVATKAAAGDTVTFQAFARDATKFSIAKEVPPFKTAVARSCLTSPENALENAGKRGLSDRT
ncbi:MAG: hypothetical protein K2X82_11125 [Gemmataceae bacterium]|nr:hypothetical protein [Gemmataceae bacterium]